MARNVQYPFFNAMKGLLEAKIFYASTFVFVQQDIFTSLVLFLRHELGSQLTKMFKFILLVRKLPKYLNFSDLEAVSERFLFVSNFFH